MTSVGGSSAVQDPGGGRVDEYGDQYPLSSKHLRNTRQRYRIRSKEGIIDRVKNENTSSP